MMAANSFKSIWKHFGVSDEFIQSLDMQHFVIVTFFASGSNDFSTFASNLLSAASASRGVLGVELGALARVAFLVGVLVGVDISVVEIGDSWRKYWL
jgi:hypothetical protein